MVAYFLCVLAFLFLRGVICARIEHLTTAEHPLEGVITNITLGEVTVSASGDVIELNGTKYTYGPTWSIFGLKFADHVKFEKLQVIAQCHTEKQCLCGGSAKEDCQPLPGETCLAYKHPNTKHHYCFYTDPVSYTNYSTYSLQELATVAFLNYGGPNAPNITNKNSNDNDEPGWTIGTTNAIQTYDYHAVIAKTRPRETVNLSDFRYVEYMGLMRVSDVKRINQRPETFKFDNDMLTCDERGFFEKDYSVSGFSPKFFEFNPKLESLTSFQPIYVNRFKGPYKTTLSSLVGKKLLSGTGVVIEWYPSQTKFTYFDPCQQKILTLRLDQNQHYYVKLPYRMKLDKEKPLCIVLFENWSYGVSGILYQTSNYSNVWTRSSEFSGILTVDYLDEVDLRVTTETNITIGAIEDYVEVSVSATSQEDGRTSAVLTLSTSKPLKCNIYISKNCSTITMTTTDKRLTTTYEVESNACDYWDAIGRYNCEGIMGSFYPPRVLVDVPLDSFHRIEADKKESFVYTNTRRKEPNNEGFFNTLINGIISIIKFLGKGAMKLLSGVGDIFIKTINGIGDLISETFWLQVVIWVVIIGLAFFGLFRLKQKLLRKWGKDTSGILPLQSQEKGGDKTGDIRNNRGREYNHLNEEEEEEEKQP